MLRTPDTRCLCSAPGTGAATLTHSWSPQAVPGWENTCWPRATGYRSSLRPPREPRALQFREKILDLAITFVYVKKIPKLLSFLVLRNIPDEVSLDLTRKNCFFSLPISMFLAGPSGSKISLRYMDPVICVCLYICALSPSVRMLSPHGQDFYVMYCWILR